MMYAVVPSGLLQKPNPLLEQNRVVYYSHHDATLWKCNASDVFDVCAVKASDEDIWKDGDGKLRLRHDCPVFASGVLYAITTIRLVPESERGGKWFLNAQEVKDIQEYLHGKDIDVAVMIRRFQERQEGMEDMNAVLLCPEGLTRDLDRATELVLANSGDMSDSGWCQYAVIEEISEGTMLESMGPNRRHFFRWKWDETKRHGGSYERISTPPEELKDIQRSLYFTP